MNKAVIMGIVLLVAATAAIIVLSTSKDKSNDLSESENEVAEKKGGSKMGSIEIIRLKGTGCMASAIKAVKEPIKMVIFGEKNFLESDYSQSGGSDAPGIIKESAQLDAVKWFEDRKTEDQEICNDPELIGEWKGPSSAKSAFAVNTDGKGGFLDVVFAARIKCANSWEIPAYLGYGDWNACPPAKIHCAVWKRWQEKYGAHIVAVGGDTVEAYVANPPKTREEAMELAWEQYFYCEDIVTQGTGTINALAGELINRHQWFFWWD